MLNADFEYVRKLVRERSGLALSAEKQYLVESRLLPLARRNGLDSLAALVGKMREPAAERLVTDVVEAMMTNESLFFRDKAPFDQFRNVVMPALLSARARQKRIRIWCAAASSGQEPYSLAMALMEMADRIAGFQIEILATDISLSVLEKAKAGIYSQFEVQRGLPISFLLKYFTQIGESWRIGPDIRGMVDFRPLNLVHPLPSFGAFDVVFCRNVLIYFDQPTKTDVLNRISKVIAPDGYLVLGSAETVMGLTNKLKPIADARGLYMPDAAPAASAKVVPFAPAEKKVAVSLR